MVSFHNGIPNFHCFIDGVVTREMCCDQSKGPRGWDACWDSIYNYEDCLAVARGGGARATLTLRPRAWAGNGKLGAHLTPL